MIHFEYSRRGATIQPKHGLHRRRSRRESRKVESCPQVTSGQRRSTIGKERGAGTVGQGGQEGGSEIGDVPAGVLGLHMRYVYTGKRSERSPYIAERAKSMHNLTRFYFFSCDKKNISDRCELNFSLFAIKSIHNLTRFYFFSCNKKTSLIAAN